MNTDDFLEGLSQYLPQLTEGEGNADHVNASAEYQSPSMGYVVNYFNQNGEYPISNLSLEGNIQAMENLNLQGGVEQFSSPEGNEYGYSLGAQYQPNEQHQLGFNMRQSPHAEEPDYGLNYRYNF